MVPFLTLLRKSPCSAQCKRPIIAMGVMTNRLWPWRCLGPCDLWNIVIVQKPPLHPPLDCSLFVIWVISPDLISVLSLIHLAPVWGKPFWVSLQVNVS